MSQITLKAHFNGERIVLDEPCDLPLNAPLMVTVLTPEVEREREEWDRRAAEGLARAYSVNEPEYTLDDVRKP
ncbi:MAG TPA: hypothetical protein VHC95_10440 [Opitutales bacterium]|nr:hypothetical protein [Opitutales bacterium]